jgi:hypothetical protein
MLQQLTEGIHRWETPHPEYRTRVEQVASYALAGADMLALVDPLLPAPDAGDRDRVLHDLDALAAVAPRVELFITIPYHTRSAEELFHRYRDDRQVRLWGHANVRKRFREDDTELSVIPRGDVAMGARLADGAAIAIPIGRPQRSEAPVYFPTHRAVAFGDAVVGTPDGARLWRQSSAGPDWYRRVFVPTLEPILRHRIEHLLLTHGPAVIGGGRPALEACLAAEPVDMY